MTHYSPYFYESISSETISTCFHKEYFFQMKLQEYLGERKRWEEEKKKKSSSQEALEKKIKEGFEEHIWNKYFLKQDDEPANDTMKSSSEVLEQTLALEASVNATLNSLFDPNSSVRVQPLYETLPPRSGHSTVPGEVINYINNSVNASVEAQVRRNSLVTDEINQRGQSVANNSVVSGSAHTEEVRERVIGEQIKGVKKVVSASKVASKIRKMSQKVLSKTLPVCSLELKSGLVQFKSLIWISN